jgi:hypothetical protein
MLEPRLLSRPHVAVRTPSLIVTKNGLQIVHLPTRVDLTSNSGNAGSRAQGSSGRAGASRFVHT